MNNTSTVLISKLYNYNILFNKLVQAGIEVQEGTLAEITFFSKAY